MALFILCIKFHLKSAMKEDLWHCEFLHGIAYCPIMYLDKQEGTLTTFVEDMLNVLFWAEETLGYKLWMFLLKREMPRWVTSSPGTLRLPCAAACAISSQSTTTERKKCTGRERCQELWVQGIFPTDFIPLCSQEVKASKSTCCSSACMSGPQWQRT